MNKAIAIARVSTTGQLDKGHSLSDQISRCVQFAKKNNLKISEMHNITGSAFKTVPTSLREIFETKKNKVLLFICVDRFSRSIKIGTELANMALRRGNSLVFIQEKIIIKKYSDIKLIKTHLSKAESESLTLSNRIKGSRSYLSGIGAHPGGFIAYGHHLVDKTVKPNVYEQCVIKFITLCKSNNIKTTQLNNIMKRISTIYTPIECLDVDGNIITDMSDVLNNSEIAKLLNDYGILKRGYAWNTRMVANIIKTKLPNPNDSILNNLDEIKQELDYIEESDEKEHQDDDDSSDSSDIMDNANNSDSDSD